MLNQLEISVRRAMILGLIIANIILWSLSVWAQSVNGHNLYRVNANGWVRNQLIGTGELYTCVGCSSPVQIQILDDPAPVNGEQYLTNDSFLKSLETGNTQRAFALSVMKDLVRQDVPMDILKTKISELGGQKVFLFQAAAKTGKSLARKTVMITVHRNRLVTVSLNYFEGGMNNASRRLVKSFLASFQFLPNP